jgi:hypothetical protein
MEYPGNAVPDSDLGKIEPFSDVAIAEALANQTINWAQESYFFPKDAHEVHLHVKIMTARAVTICSNYSKQFRLHPLALAGSTKGLRGLSPLAPTPKVHMKQKPAALGDLNVA